VLVCLICMRFFFFSSRRRHTRCLSDWSSDVCSSDLIARLLDGGTTDDGLPFFVMEYIEGQPVYRFCDAQRLTVAERLRLFCQVRSEERRVGKECRCRLMRYS